MLLAALALGATLNCADPAEVMEVWRPGIEAFQAQDLAKAKAVTDDIIATCGDDPVTHFPRVMRAEIALRHEDPQGALTALAPVPRPASPPIGAYPSFLALRAQFALQDAENFAQERDRLFEATVRALTEPSGRFKGRLVETFSVENTRVAAIEADFANGPFRRRFVFLVASDQPFASPRSIMLTSNPMADALGGPKVLFLDEYDCTGHVTLEMLNRKPSYRTLKAKVSARLQGKLEPASGTQGGACVFTDYIAPGFAEQE